MLARARDRCKSARRRTGYDRDRIDARYRIADDRGAQERWAGVKEPQTGFALPIRRIGGFDSEAAIPKKSIAKTYIAMSMT
jgi:hypothetical protein